jgi:hypothetical protein
MSMMRSAVADQSRTIGVGSAATVPLEGLLDFAMTCARPERENTRTELSKAYAIVYNAARRGEMAESFIFSNCWVSRSGLLNL